MAYDWPSVNRVTLIGCVKRVREFTFDDGSVAFHVAMATKRLHPTKSGLITILDWHNVVIPGLKRVKYIRQRIYKNTILYVEGRIRTHPYDKGTDTRRIYQDIICDYYQIMRDGQEQVLIEQRTQDLHEDTRDLISGVFDKFDEFHESKEL